MNGNCDKKTAFALILWTAIFLLAVAVNCLFMWLVFIGVTVIEIGIIFLSDESEVEYKRRGKWIAYKRLSSSKCSECGHTFENETRYCPYCGTKMESEDK